MQPQVLLVLFERGPLNVLGFRALGGFVSNLARPGGNLTGFENFQPEIGGRWLEILKDAAPGGGLISYGIDQLEQWRGAPGYVDRILKGEKPGDLPVQALNKYELVMNFRTAKAIGVNVPTPMLDRADKMIE